MNPRGPLAARPAFPTDRIAHRSNGRRPFALRDFNQANVGLGSGAAVQHLWTRFRSTSGSRLLLRQITGLLRANFLP
jgi:hypothetical protein